METTKRTAARVAATVAEGAVFLALILTAIFGPALLEVLL